MNSKHKSKTVSCLLSVVVGALGLHRFYLYGRRDFMAWIYLGATLVYLTILAASLVTDTLELAVASLFPVPVFVAAVEALSIGVVEDAKWDARHNPHSSRSSKSGWPLSVLLVLTLAVTFTAFVASMARATDLLFTGGSFG